MTQAPFTGYPGQVWLTCYQSIVWLNNLLGSGSAPAASVANPAAVVFQTLRNGAAAIEAWQNGASLTIESENMSAVEGVPITLDPTTTAYLTARVTGIQAAASGISALPPKVNVFNAVSLLENGQPAIPSPGYLEWCMAFNNEPTPSALATQPLTTVAQAEANAWLTIANAINVAQGANPTSAYDTAARQYRCSQIIATQLLTMNATISQTALLVPMIDSSGNIMFDSSGNIMFTDVVSTAGSLLWNTVVALPTILLDGSALSTSPALLQAQQAMVIRNTLNKTAQAIAQFLFSLRTSIASAPITAILANNDTLLDLAARETGNFENWTTIASINNLSPPYPGPTNPAIAQSGRQLYMPGSNIALGASSTPPSYPNDAMGTDYWFGPINGQQPAWNGDIQLITGLLNFAMALGRRIQTPIGTLTYHQEYGSRIPGEVGAVQSSDEAARLAAFGRAALAADKRTGRILKTSSSVQPGSLATFAGTVVPIGPGATPVTIGDPSGFITIPVQGSL